MLPVISWNNLTDSEQKNAIERLDTKGTLSQTVHQIIDRVKQSGDQALYELTKEFDSAQLSSLRVPEAIIRGATINQECTNAINKAIETIKSYHQSVIPETKEIITHPGIRIRTAYRPIQKVGLYVPGGNKTPLISSLLMQAIAAQIAGCPVKVLCTPPNSKGEVDSRLLVTARLCGIETIHPIGGAQAIAAMAYGTESVVKVDKLYGPGNAFVTEAKSIVSMDPNGAAIDMPAGPSEVMILADDEANPVYIAADLLSQAEHGPDSQVILLCGSKLLAEQVNIEIAAQITYLQRTQLIKQSLSTSLIILCPDREEQIRIINDYAPEHLIINCADAELLVTKIMAAGSVFLGQWSAVAMGDYITGSNHVLPTNGYARNHNGLNTLDFMTRFSVQDISIEGIQELGPYAIAIAEMEGLDAHANSISIRLANRRNQ